MNNLSKLVIAALAFGGSISAASAAGVITDVEIISGQGSIANVDIDGRTIDFDKTFNTLDPIVLEFTVEHATGPGTPYTVTEDVTNNTGQSWIDFHYTIGEPDPAQGVVFTAHQSSTFGDFTLDQSSGPRNLDFSESTLAHSDTAAAAFNISPFDPGQGNTTTFTLTQVPTIPEPETYAMLLAGLGLMGFIAKRRNSNQQA